MKLKPRSILLAMLWVSVTILAASVNAASDKSIRLWVQANQAFEQGEYRQSIESYEQLLSQGLRNGHVYYNLGNAWFREGELGRAIGYYLTARQYQPRFEDLLGNLSYAQGKTVDKLEAGERHWKQDLRDFTHRFTLKEWGVLSAFSWLVLWVVLAAWYYWRREVLGWVLTLSIALSLFSLAGVGCWWLAEEPQGVILTETGKVYSAPNQQAVTLFELHEGTTIVVEQIHGDWLKIRFGQSKRGYLLENQVFQVPAAF